MRELAASGMTMMVITHEMGLARDVAKRIVRLAESHEHSGRSDIAVDLYEVERALNASVRRLTKLVNA